MTVFLGASMLILGALMGAGITFYRQKYAHLQEMSELKSQLDALQVRYEVLLQNYNESNEDHKKQLQKMEIQFENLAQKIFEEKSIKFTEQNQKNISQVLEPIKDKLKEFQQKIEMTYSQEQNERGFLRGEISKLIELNQTMSSEARNLTRALKGENKTQGNWGELILENILERSGLRRDEEYIVQGTGLDLANDEGKFIQPDVI
ncbi:MAG: DNA recombination protein RmuC, partial [Bdellovibrionia bacterium]